MPKGEEGNLPAVQVNGPNEQGQGQHRKNGRKKEECSSDLHRSDTMVRLWLVHVGNKGGHVLDEPAQIIFLRIN